MWVALKRPGCVVAFGIINITLRSAFLFAVYPKYKLFIKILSSSLNTTLIVDKLQ